MSKTKDEVTPDWSSIKKQAPGWFSDAKFGLFFHWGPYSVPAFENEWYSRNMYEKGSSANIYHEQHYGKVSTFGYKDFYKDFTGSRFDPEQWADMVVSSGAKYAGPVSEHCDNFSMWDSKVNPVNCVNYGPKRDITGECADAFRKRGIKVLSTFHHHWLWGWFMSTDPEADVYLPENEVYYGSAQPLETKRFKPCRYPDPAFCRQWADKVREVIDRYHPDVLYFDGRAFIIDERTRFDLARYYYTQCEGGIITYKEEDFPAQTGVYDIESGRFATGQPCTWQTDERLEDNTTWSIVKDPKYKSAKRMIVHLCDVVSKNGNLLLNVAPYADGTFDEKAKRILKEIGDWLLVNGEAIYATRPYATAVETTVSADAKGDRTGQIHTGDDDDARYQNFAEHEFRFTRKAQAVYAIAFGWPASGHWEIRTFGSAAYKKKITKVTLLGIEEALNFRQTAEALVVKAPDRRPCEHAYAIRIE